jgi:hypothetical protein
MPALLSSEMASRLAHWRCPATRRVAARPPNVGLLVVHVAIVRDCLAVMMTSTGDFGKRADRLRETIADRT